MFGFRFCFRWAPVLYSPPARLFYRAQPQTMSNSDHNTVIVAKTRELCDLILRQPEVAAACRSVETFMQDQAAQALYQALMERGQALHEKQERTQTLTDGEIAEFEKHREQLVANPTAKNFLDARELFHGIHHLVSDHVSKAFELGRVPEAADFDSECCGNHSCGCRH